VARLDKNRGATAVTFTPAELADIRDTMEAHTVTGERYPTEFKAMSGR
jgi:hypothetical protein